MFPSTVVDAADSPQKRKHTEYHDPDYPVTVEQHVSSSKRARNNGANNECVMNNALVTAAQAGTSGAPNVDVSSGITNNNQRLNRVCEIISREFQREITLKQQQLEQIDERLTQARQLLDRLRYAIVAEYYKKQEAQLTQAEAVAVRGNQTLLDHEPQGPQMMLHPSLKKIIGKKPTTNIQDILRACPERAAAQNAKHTMRARTHMQKRQERRLQQLIREQGIVIDHSKEDYSVDQSKPIDVVAKASELLAAQQAANVSIGAATAKEKPHLTLQPVIAGKVLNASRLNNKVKHLVVVGNTSKYIGTEYTDGEEELRSQTLSHKWLVYVQSKNTAVPLESLVKKVRFFLHPSYRPNDIVDIDAPPFQITRRGWGEFPVRIQLYFHEHLQQKSIQLQHNLVLDKTLSGMHTLGAETLLEIWLRSPATTTTTTTNVNGTISQSPNINQQLHTTPRTPTTSLSTATAIMTPTKMRAISFTNNKEELDDNLFEFLNKIEDTARTSLSADIEKIQPTVMITEPLTSSLVTTSPCKLSTEAIRKQPQTMPSAIKVQLQNNNNNEKEVKVASSLAASQPQSLLTAAKNTTATAAANKNMKNTALKETNTLVKVTNNTQPATKDIGNILLNHSSAATRATSTLVRLSNAKNNILGSSALKIIPNNTNNKRTIILNTAKTYNASPNNIVTLPKTAIITSANVVKSNTMTATTTTTEAPKKFLQKRLVQLVDAEGNVKYVQMLVATNNTAPSTSIANINVIPKLTTTLAVGNKITATTTPAPPPLAIQSTNNNKFQPVLIKTAPLRLKLANTELQAIRNTTPLLASLNVAVNSLKESKNSSNMPFKSNQITKANVTPPKNVFQKGGKLYIVDPQQMKLKQQQKQQVSLLKPQISLLKQQQLPQQQQQQKQQQQPAIIGTFVSDHDYFPTPVAPALTKPNTAAIRLHPLDIQQSHNKHQPPPLHWGLKQTRANSVNIYERQQKQCLLFETKFQNVHFYDMQSAVIYLLRRLPLVARTKNSIVAALPFVCATLLEFQAMPAFKQRACEWLRAKYIGSMLQKHKGLQQLHDNASDIFWSTREIFVFARFHAYVPSTLKMLPNGEQSTLAHTGATPEFKQLVKSELHEQRWQNADTLTINAPIANWLTTVNQKLQQYEFTVNDNQIIDVDGMTDSNADDRSTQTKGGSTRNSPLNSTNDSSNKLFMGSPAFLEHEMQLVAEICKDLCIRLEPQFICAGVLQDSAQTVLAQCLHLFIEKLVRQTVAYKLQQQQLHETRQTLPHVAAANLLLNKHDFGSVLAHVAEFDFLTNANFGIAATTTTTTHDDMTTTFIKTKQEPQ